MGWYYGLIFNLVYHTFSMGTIFLMEILYLLYFGEVNIVSVRMMIQLYLPGVIHKNIKHIFMPIYS